ncbi:MAG: aminopeptidase [Chloroflexota bacterium]|nr:aminopeptidase [Chloroflexota bacterium]
MKDSRLEQYARLLVEHSIDVQPGWQVLVASTHLARPLVEEVARQIAQRGAYAIVRIYLTSFGPYPPLMDLAWASEAPEELLGQLAPVERYVVEHIDAAIQIGAPENLKDGSDFSLERLALIRQANSPMRERTTTGQIPWVLCHYPTVALAQEAGMTLPAYEDFLYGACLLDWNELGSNIRRIAARFDSADEVRITGEGTDLLLGLKGRHAGLGDGRTNIPDGEFFYSPVEDATEGTITFSEFPALYAGQEVEGARLVFRGGKVVEATARHGEEFLLHVLDSDPAARVLGELGIGCNPGIQRFMKNTLFDEKIDGTIHLALGNGFPHLGGRNRSTVHWDMVKDLRKGGSIYCDGELVQESGRWLI